MTDKPAPINRPLTDDERHLMIALATRVIADQSGIPHTEDALHSDDCRSCAVASSVLGEFVDRGEVYLTGDHYDAYLEVPRGKSIVHCTREWLSFHAEHPEAVDLDKHQRRIEPNGEDTDE